LANSEGRTSYNSEEHGSFVYERSHYDPKCDTSKLIV
jgi:hypothetical protein